MLGNDRQLPWERQAQCLLPGDRHEQSLDWIDVCAMSPPPLGSQTGGPTGERDLSMGVLSSGWRLGGMAQTDPSPSSQSPAKAPAWNLGSLNVRLQHLSEGTQALGYNNLLAELLCISSHIHIPSTYSADLSLPLPITAPLSSLLLPLHLPSLPCWGEECLVQVIPQPSLVTPDIISPSDSRTFHL
jgi:hypothetical protein